ncbi:site-2 protease family protein [Candidatus Micrarchaeota archaeon]|nr:site-2 protease family protein [Candidatus Micrarchaeota archaeon]
MISLREARDIVISVVAISLALTIATSGSSIFSSIPILILRISFFAITVGIGFVIHELSHKFVAQKFGAYAEFFMWPLGLVIALATSFLGFVFVAPGAVYIQAQRITKRQNGLISLAGPLSNLIIGCMFLFIGAIFPFNIAGLSLWGFGSFVNFWLGMFNMLPIHPLDGGKIMDWSMPVWGGMMALFVFLVFF